MLLNPFQENFNLGDKFEGRIEGTTVLLYEVGSVEDQMLSTEKDTSASKSLS